MLDQQGEIKMSVQLSPGVQVIEKDFTQNIPTVSTSTGAIAGPFTWGPVEQPVLVSNEADLVSAYGQPTRDCNRTFWVAKNFLDYSKSMYVTRTDSSDGRNAVARQSGRVSSVTVISSGSGFKMTPTIAVEAPEISGGQTAILKANLIGGVLTAAIPTNPGIGYSVGDIIIFGQPEVPQETFDPVSGVLTDSVFKNARGKVGAVNETGGIVSIILQSNDDVSLTRGAGYIDADAITYSVLNADGTATSSGTGAVFDLQVGRSGIKSISIVSGGSGYVTEQLPLSVTILPDINDDGTAFVNPVINFDITTSATKIKNRDHYSAAFAGGQCLYGEFAAKYPGTRGNGIIVSMCDQTNWRSQVYGEFYARKTIEPRENPRELLMVRRVIDGTSEFDNSQLDNGKILRTNSGKLIGEIDHVEPDIQYKITLKTPAQINIEDGTHISRFAYGANDSTKFDIIKFKRTGTQITVTLRGKPGPNNTTIKHSYRVGDFIDAFIAPRSDLSNIIDGTSKTSYFPASHKFPVIATTEDTVTYFAENPTWSVSTGSESAVSGYIRSTSQGYVDGFVKEFNEENDEYEISRSSFYIKKAPNFDMQVGSTLATWNGTKLGIINTIEKVQTIVLSTAQSASANDVFGESCVTEWKYKSNFGSSAPSTSAFVKKAGGLNDELHIIVLNSSGTVLEKFSNVSKALDAKDSTGKSIYYKNVINNTSNWLWFLDHPTDIEDDTSKASWGSLAENNNFKLLTNAVTRKLSGGVSGNAASASHYINAYSLFADPVNYDVSLFPIDSSDVNTIKSIITNVIEKRRDCVAFISPPLTIGNSMAIAQSIVAFRNRLGSSSYAAMDSGWKYQYDKYTDEFRWIPLCGDIAGLCAYADAVADPWVSPAGFNRGQIKNVVKLSFNPTLPQRDLLYTNGVNPVVTFPAEGTVLYGDKTLQVKTSAFDRLPVRRLFIVIEKSIALASKYQLFEFNDDFTRAQFRSSVEPYLRDIQGRRGITSFLVKCDTSNNTPTVIDRNEFIADIYIKPARSINFITLNFVATKTGVSFDEIIG